MQSITPPPSTPAPGTEVSIIRTGRDGRLRFTPEQRRDLLAAFDRGGQSAMASTRDHGVHYQTFIVSCVRGAVWTLWRGPRVAVIVAAGMTETPEMILKADRRGRLRFTHEQRSAMLEAYDASGLSGPK